MLFRQRGTGRILWPIAAMTIALGLAMCSGFDDRERQPAQPSFYRSLASADAELDAATAQSMISGYRHNNGLPPLTLDPALMKLASEQARLMASRDKTDHGVGRPLKERMSRSGFNTRVSAENVSAGYHTLAEAFSGWRDSPPHKATMLLKGATHMGIAAVYAPNSKYKVFWTLIVATPEDVKG